MLYHTIYIHALFNIYFIMYAEVRDEDLKKLKLLEPEAAVLTSLDCSDTDSARESNKENEDPLEPLSALYDENLRGLSPRELQEKSEETFYKLGKEMTREKCLNLERITKNQNQNQLYSPSTCTHTRNLSLVICSSQVHTRVDKDVQHITI